jgi:hypothetical protein
MTHGGRMAAAGTLAALVVAAGWVVVRDRPSSAWAVTGVRAALERIELEAPAPSSSVDLPPSEDEADGGTPDAADDDGEMLSDLLMEAELRAKLAAAGDAGPSPAKPEPGPAPRPPEPAPTQPPLGSATRMRRIGEQVVAICASGRAAEVRVLAEELLRAEPPPWLARKIRAACSLDEIAPPAPEVPQHP